MECFHLLVQIWKLVCACDIFPYELEISIQSTVNEKPHFSDIFLYNHLFGILSRYSLLQSPPRY